MQSIKYIKNNLKTIRMFADILKSVVGNINLLTTDTLPLDTFINGYTFFYCVTSSTYYHIYLNLTLKHI